MNDQSSIKHKSQLEKRMNEFKFYLGLSIVSLLAAIGALIWGILLITDEFYTGAIIIFIAFLLTPLAVRNFIRFLQGSKAYKIVKKLKENKKTSRLLELANLRELNAPKIAKLQMMFSINALVDMGEEQILSILIEQYKTALEHDFQAERFEEPLQIMAEKLGYNNFHQLLEEKAVRYEKDKE